MNLMIHNGVFVCMGVNKHKHTHNEMLFLDIGFFSGTESKFIQVKSFYLSSLHNFLYLKWLFVALCGVVRRVARVKKRLH